MPITQGGAANKHYTIVNEIMERAGGIEPPSSVWKAMPHIRIYDNKTIG
jgi:hypothetical protein